MKLFIQASDYEVWRIILNGLIIPTKKVGDQEMVKQEDEWDVNDLKSAQLNAKAMHTLFCALGAREYLYILFYIIYSIYYNIIIYSIYSN